MRDWESCLILAQGGKCEKCDASLCGVAWVEGDRAAAGREEGWEGPWLSGLVVACSGAAGSVRAGWNGPSRVVADCLGVDRVRCGRLATRVRRRAGVEMVHRVRLLHARRAAGCVRAGWSGPSRVVVGCLGVGRVRCGLTRVGTSLGTRRFLIHHMGASVAIWTQVL